MTENFEDDPPVILKYGGNYELLIRSIEKKRHVSIKERPCVNKEQFPDYDQAMVSYQSNVQPLHAFFFFFFFSNSCEGGRAF